MRAYSESNEEARRARDLLKDWAGEDFLTAEQYARMEQETICEFRRTNVFLRVVLFLFTLIIVAAAVALFFVVIFPHADEQAGGIALLIFAVVCYAAAEFAVAEAKLYRYGIEEALVACSVGFLCVGLQGALFHGRTEFLIPMAGAVGSLWIWCRFGLPYAFLAAMIFIVWLSDSWTLSHAGQHVMIAACYAAGLLIVIALRPRKRFTYRNGEYAIAEALLWLGIYLAVNLQLSSVDLLGQWVGGTPGTSEFPAPFYWGTWVLIWCLPPVVLTRGLRLRDRWIIGTGAIVALLTLVTNKPYLGWPRHTWDPMLLGAVLIGLAQFLRRWLAGGPGGIRRGFTAQRFSGKDKTWINAGAGALGLVAPSMIPPAPQPVGSDVHFGGGDSGGGGATSDF